MGKGNGFKKHVGIIKADLAGFSKIKAHQYTKVDEIMEEFANEKLNMEGVDYYASEGDSFLVCCSSFSMAGKLALDMLSHFTAMPWTEMGFDHRMPIRIAVHAGEVTLKQRENGNRVSGQAITVAARMEPAVPPCSVLCSEHFVNSLKAADPHDLDTQLYGAVPLAKDYGEMDMYQLAYTGAGFTALPEPECCTPAEVSPVEMPGPVQKAFRQMERHVEGDEDWAKHARELICFFQGQIISYFYQASNKHHALKLALGKKKPSLPTIRKRVKELDDYLYYSLVSDIWPQAQKMTAQLFEYTKGPRNAPRMCMKVHTVVDGETMVQVMARDKRVNYDEAFSPCPVHANTASMEVEGNGIYYLCNDIPKEISRGEYDYHRINNDRAKEYYKQGKYKEVKKGEKDVEWEKCWHPVRNENGRKMTHNVGSCFKSTLVVPMTLINNSLGREFWDIVTKKAGCSGLLGPGKNMSIKDAERWVFGYFCMDSVETNYFDVQETGFDICLGYLMADLFSICLFINQTYTTLSKTYSQATKKLAGNGKKPTGRKTGSKKRKR